MLTHTANKRSVVSRLSKLGPPGASPPRAPSSSSPPPPLPSRRSAPHFSAPSLLTSSLSSLLLRPRSAPSLALPLRLHNFSSSSSASAAGASTAASAPSLARGDAASPSPLAGCHGDMPVPEMLGSVNGPGSKAPRWEPFPRMAQRRVYAAATLQADGRLLYVLGGCGETGAPLDTAEVLDLESQTWSPLPPLASPRAGASAVALPGGQVMVLGGMDHQQTALASVEVYHPDEGRWECCAALGQPSMGVTALEKVRLLLSILLPRPASILQCDPLNPEQLAGIRTYTVMVVVVLVVVELMTQGGGGVVEMMKMMMMMMKMEDSVLNASRTAWREQQSHAEATRRQLGGHS
ncbi:hypothetical protein CRUP_001585, partial [Coryphaenoides rupestris]